jgi:hypothetical protein
LKTEFLACMNAGAMGIEPSVIAKLQGAGERGKNI